MPFGAAKWYLVSPSALLCGCSREPIKPLRIHWPWPDGVVICSLIRKSYLIWHATQGLHPPITFPKYLSAPRRSIPCCAWVWRSVFTVEAFRAIGPRFQFEINVRIRYLIACRPIADHEEHRILLCDI